MRLVRNIFYISGAIIGAGLLLYFAVGIAAFAYLGAFNTGRRSLPAPMQLSTGDTYNVTPDCPMTIIGIGGTFPDRLYARIRSRTMGRDSDQSYGIGDSVECFTPSGRRIEADLKSIDLDRVHFAFEWDH